MIPLLSKFGLPIIVFLAGIVGGMAVNQKLQKPAAPCKCPSLTCPDPKPCQGIDFDKIKAKGLTIQNTQYLTVKGDSVTADMVRKALREELEDFKVRKCK